MIERLNAAVAAAQIDKTLVDTLAPEGAELTKTTPQQFSQYLAAEIARYTELRSKVDLRLE